LNALLQIWHSGVTGIIFGGEYALANFFASRSDENAKGMQRFASSGWKPSTGLVSVEIHFCVSWLKCTEY
jgi:hypothetical protein